MSVRWSATKSSDYDIAARWNSTSVPPAALLASIVTMSFVEVRAQCCLFSTRLDLFTLSHQPLEKPSLCRAECLELFLMSIFRDQTLRDVCESRDNSRDCHYQQASSSNSSPPLQPSALNKIDVLQPKVIQPCNREPLARCCYQQVPVAYPHLAKLLRIEMRPQVSGSSVQLLVRTPFRYSHFKISCLSLNKKFQQVLAAAAPGAHITQSTGPDSSELYYEGDLLIGVYDKTTGASQIYPKLSELKPATNIDHETPLNDFLNDPKTIPKDDTTYKVVKGDTLAASQKKIDGDAGPPQDFLVEGIIQRNVKYENNLVPVCGPGSKSGFRIGAGGVVLGVSHQAKSAKTTTSNLTPLSQSDIQTKIAEQLTAANIKNVVINNVALCFYDSGANYIQPVFKYDATISNGNGVADNTLVGYIPAAGTEKEPLPSLITPSGQAQPAVSNNGTDHATKERRQSSIKVGRYAMSNDQYSPQIVVDENDFLSGLQSASSRFVNSQFYWDEPYMYAGSAATYVDSVNIAFTEGHGNVHMFTTNEKEAGWGPVYISSSIASSGFGPGAGGSLAYWIIRACDTVSTALEYSAADQHLAFDPWWPVFNGIHAVMGYRTEAQVYDNEMGNVGKVIGQGASVVHGWMNAAAGGGKTSAVVVCGHDDDNVFNIDNLGKATCLTIWYLY
ncbi:hypothetical protein G7Y89_g386 [Cudoniella acicularis]|uniref:Uncharacterized protein n=1 Tax=Cudoniella acicularis TaxID=354080 RepID=A0A8H4S008_9HELO|nr:hypothetical protein G7Y89_g386 [Cudoniella acicularis]